MVELPISGTVAALQSSRQQWSVRRINGVICCHKHAIVLTARETSADALAVIWVAVPGNTMQVERSQSAEVATAGNTFCRTPHELPTALMLAGVAQAKHGNPTVDYAAGCCLACSPRATAGCTAPGPGRQAPQGDGPSPMDVDEEVSETDRCSCIDEVRGPGLHQGPELLDRLPATRFRPYLLARRLPTPHILAMCRAPKWLSFRLGPVRPVHR